MNRVENLVSHCSSDVAVQENLIKPTVEQRNEQIIALQKMLSELEKAGPDTTSKNLAEYMIDQKLLNIAF